MDNRNEYLYAISKGKLLKKETNMEIFEFLREIQNKYNSVLELETEVTLVDTHNVNFLQTKFSNVSFLRDSEYTMFVEEKPNRLVRFFLAMLIVLITTTMCYLLIKSSVDWATMSKIELNKLKANKLEEITRTINDQYSYILNNE
jgi:hypothetical protein